MDAPLFVILVHIISPLLNQILPNFCCNLELFSGIKGFEENFFLFFWLNKIKFEKRKKQSKE